MSNSQYRTRPAPPIYLLQLLTEAGRKTIGTDCAVPNSIRLFPRNNGGFGLLPASSDLALYPSPILVAKLVGMETIIIAPVVVAGRPWCLPSALYRLVPEQPPQADVATDEGWRTWLRMCDDGADILSGAAQAPEVW